jgi:hypothetical protein
MKKNHSLNSQIFRSAVVAFFAVAGSACVHAQQSIRLAEVREPASLLFAAPDASAKMPSLNLTDDRVAYSSSTGANELAAAEDFALTNPSAAEAQPAPRRRYGRPNYSDKMHNADGSNKITILAGGGFTVPAFTPSTNYLTTSWKVQGGVGYNFNKKFGVVLQFDYDNFGLPANVINSQTAVYTSLYGNTVSFAGLDGHTHDWSFTLNPTYTFYQGESTGAYAVVGGGFYHKVTNFTLPTTGVYCDYYYGCYQYTANQTFDEYTSNAAGINGGIGFTFKPSRFASERFYAEARYVFNFNSQRPGNNATNFYPGNSSTTSYVPVTVGIRF